MIFRGDWVLGKFGSLLLFVTVTAIGYFGYKYWIHELSALEITTWTVVFTLFVTLFLRGYRQYLGLVYSDILPTILLYSLWYGTSVFLYWLTFWYGLSLTGAGVGVAVISLMIVVTPLASRLFLGKRFPKRFKFSATLVIVGAALGAYNQDLLCLYKECVTAEKQKSDSSSLLGPALLFLATLFHASYDLAEEKFDKYTSNRNRSVAFLYRRADPIPVFASVIVIYGLVFASLVSFVSALSFDSSLTIAMLTERHWIEYAILVFLGIGPGFVLFVYIPRSSVPVTGYLLSMGPRPLIYLALAWSLFAMGVVQDDPSISLNETWYIGVALGSVGFLVGIPHALKK